jgi:hypothetical protein
MFGALLQRSKLQLDTRIGSNYVQESMLVRIDSVSAEESIVVRFDRL